MIEHIGDVTQIPLDGNFIAHEHLEGRNFDIEFHWVPLDKINNIEIYPSNAAEILGRLGDGVQHFVYREK